MRWLRPLALVAPASMLVLQLASVRTAEGLPLFARKYSMPCTSCHMAFPRLNSFGMAFRQNGYRMPGTKGESPWEAKEFPISLVGNVGMVASHQTRPDSTAVMFVQNAVEFHSAGTLAANVSFHFDNDFAGVDLPLTSGQAYVIFDDVVRDGKLNIKVGIFDADLPYLAASRSTSQSAYLSPVTFGGQGVELNGAQSGWTYGLGMNTSSRTYGQAGKTYNTFESPFAWLVREVHGQMVGARVYMDRQDPRDPAQSGASHTQVDASVYLNGARWVVIPAVTFESFGDADPALVDPADPANGAHDQVRTGMLEALYQFGKDQRWLFTGRYERRNMPAFGGLEAENDQLVVGNVSYYVNPNCKLGVEWSHAADDIGGPALDQGQLFVHVGY
jgi:hypothetical protein